MVQRGGFGYNRRFIIPRSQSGKIKPEVKPYKALENAGYRKLKEEELVTWIWDWTIK
jgi:hypothetical protein